MGSLVGRVLGDDDLQGVGYDASGERQRPKDEEEMDVGRADDGGEARSGGTSADQGDELARNGVNRRSLVVSRCGWSAALFEKKVIIVAGLV